MDRYTTQDGNFTVKPEDLQVFMQLYPDAQKVGGEVEEQKEIQAIKDVDTSPAGAFFNVLQTTNPAAGLAISNLGNILKSTVDIVDMVGDFGEFLAEVEVEKGGLPAASAGLSTYMAKRMAAAKSGITQEEYDEKDPYNIIELSAISKALDKSVIKYKDKETGKPLDFIDLYKAGEIQKGTVAFLNETAGAIPSMLMSRVPGVYALLGGGSFINKLDEGLFERQDQTTEALFANSLIYGGADAVGEFFGGRYLNRLAGLGKTGSKEAIDDVKDVMIGGIGAFIKTAFKGGSFEGMQEAITALIQTAGDDLIYGDDKTAAQYFRQALHSGLIGFATGGVSGTGSLTMNKANKEKFYEYVSGQDYKNEQMRLGSLQLEAEQDLENAPANKKEKFQKRVDSIKNQRKKLKDQLIATFENNPDILQYHIDNLEIMHEELDIITGGDKYSRKAKDEAKKRYLEAAKNNNDLFAATDIDYKAINDLNKGITAKTAEKLRERRKNLWFKAKDIKYEFIDTTDKFKKLIEEKGAAVALATNGFAEIVEDGKTRIVINESVAASAEAGNVIGHELLHYAMSNRFANDPEGMRESIINFRDYIKQLDGGNYILKSLEKSFINGDYALLDKNKKIQYDEDGLVIMQRPQDIEEYFNKFSDLIDSELIKPAKEASSGFLNSFRTMARGLGIGANNIDFKDGKQVFELLVDYNKNINRKGLLGAITQKGIIKTVSGKKTTVTKKATSKASRSKAVDAVNEIEQKLKNKLKAEGKDYTKEEFLKSEEFNSIFRSINLENGFVNNYLKVVIPDKSRRLKTIEEINDRILGYNPQAKRKAKDPKTGKVSEKPVTIGERIMSDKQFGKLDAERDLAIEAKKEGKTLRIDAAKRTEEGETTFDIEDTAVDTQQETLETEDISPQAEARRAAEKAKGKQKVESEFRRKIGIETGSDLYNKVLETARKVLLRAYKIGKPVRQIQRDLRNEANLYLFKDIKNFLGTKQYISNLKKFREPIMKVMFTSDLVQMEREVAEDKKVFTKFVKKLTTLKEVQNAVDQSLLPPSALNSFKRDKSVNLYEKANPTEEQFLSFFDIPTINPVTGVRSGKRGTRKDQLAKYMSGALTYDATLEVAQEKEVAEKRQQIAELNGETVDDNDVQVLAAAIDRNPNIKFSKSAAKPVVNRNIAYHLKEVLQQNKVITKQDFEEYSRNLTYQVPGQGVTIGTPMNDKDKALFAREGFNITNAARYERAKDETLHKQLIKGVEQARKNGKVKNEGLVNEDKANKIIDNNTSGELTEGSGDAYISYASVIFGIEHKLGIAQFVSRTLNAVGNTLKFTTKNDTIDQKTGKLFEEAIIKKVLEVRKEVNKFLSDNNIETIKDFNKPLSLEQIAAVKAFKSSFQVDTTVSLDYVMRDYVLNKYADNNSQSFLTIEGGVYLMETDSDSYRNAKTAVDIFNLGKPEDQQIKNLKFTKDINSIDVHISLQVSEKGIINHRLRPKLNSDHFEKSNVNIYKDAKAAKEFGQALDKAAEQIGLVKLSKSIKFSRSAKNPTKGISILDFDDTLATTKSLVKYTAPDGTTGTLNAEQFASTYQDLQDQGYKFDFSDFNKVVKGKLAPLFQKALKLQNKFGSENMFVLTARPPAAQKAIFDFLKANGLNIPLKNITGLGNSTSEAKALWVADKVSEGYNDFYFADDALQNVQAVDNVLSQFDVKRKVQQAKVKFSLSTKQNLNWKTDSIGYMTTNFNVGGNNYKITFYPTDLNDTNYELEFDLVTEKGLTQEITGTGNQFKVLGIVYNGLLDLIKQNPNIETIGFSSLTKDKSRARVYTILMDRLGKRLGWKTDIYEYGSGTQLDFEVAKPKTRKPSTKTTESIRNIPAVKNLLNQSDVKSPTQQDKVKFSKNMSKEFNDILQDVTGIETQKRFSEAKAKKRGEGKGRFRFFIPPSHEDFVGLLYNFIGKGEQGNKHRDFFEKALIQPLNRAYRELNMAKQAIANDYRNLTKKMPDIRKKLTQSTPDGDFTYDDAVRVYLWNKFGFDIPGLTKTDTNKLIELVNLDGKLKMFADKVGLISKMDEGYVEPGEHWLTGSIKQDLADATGRVGRKKFFAEFIENSDQIFGKIVNGKLVGENANKIRAAYGDNFVEALEDMLYATQNGTNRKQGSNKQVNAFLDYLNGSVGATMFFNARSAVLQTLSTVNFINFGDNNIFKAAARFADQPQFWKDFSMIFNSDYLKQRRAGVGFDVNGAEIAAAVKKSKEPVKAAIAYILNKGFLPTQMADSFAIALGGSSMYRNRVNTYIKKGLSKKEAETKAFEDFQATAESTQQSARPDMLSQLQRSALGRMIFAFQNVTSQYARLIKKSTLDLVKRRKTPPYDTQVQSDMSNISKIIYYGAIQNLIFYSLQSALFAMSFEDDEDEDKKNEKFFKTKKQRLINGSIDSILRGSGLPGAVLSVVKNAVIKYGEQNEKGWGRKLGVISDELLQISPPVGIKIRKLDSFEKTMAFNQKVIPEMDTFDLDNPIWDAYGNLVEGATNVPVARLLRKVENVRSALNSENAWWQRVALGLGWSKWELGIEDREIKEVKDRIKNNNKQINKDTKKRKQRTFKRRTFKN